VFGDEAGKRNLKKQKNQAGPFRVSPWKRSNSNSIFLEFEFQTRSFADIVGVLDALENTALRQEVAVSKDARQE